MIRFQTKRPIDGDAAIIQLFVRLMGLLWGFVFIDTFIQWPSLCGESGLLPIGEFADRVQGAYQHWSFFRFPSLLWISPTNAFAFVLFALGLLGTLMALSDRLATLGLTIAFSVWLSFVNFGGDFFAYIWDTFLLEMGFLAIFSSWMRNAGGVRKLATWALWVLNFRLWFSMGMVKLMYNNAPWMSLDVMDWFYPNQPMPTSFAWHLAQLPDWMQKATAALILGTEVLVPFLIVWKRTRAVAWWIFLALSILIHVAGNYAWFNIMSVIAAVPLLVGTRMGTRWGEWLMKSGFWGPYLRIDPQYDRLRDWPLKLGAGLLQFQMVLQAALIVLLAFPLGNRYLNFLNYTAYRPDVVAWEGGNALKTTLLVPLRAGSNFRIANPYGVFKNIAVRRWELVFEASTDTAAGYWHPYPYHFKPGAGNPPKFYAPHFPRFEQQLFYEAQQGSFYRHNTFSHIQFGPSCWTTRLVERLKAGDDPTPWFYGDPLHGQKPQALRVWVKELRFTTPAERAATGSYWASNPVFLLNLDATPDCPLVPDSVYTQWGKHTPRPAQE